MSTSTLDLFKGRQSSAVIAIAATFTADPLLPAMQFMLHEAGMALDVRLAPYNQLFQELLSSTSLLAMNADGVDVILVRVEDFVREVEKPEDALAIIKRTAAELTNALLLHSRRMKVPTVLVVMPPSPRVARALLPEIDAANAALVEYAGSLDGITLLSSDDFDLMSGERYDSESDELAHIPFTEEHYASIAIAIVRKVHALRVPAHKVLVLDCDETLWRGVVGEDGPDGVTIPPESRPHTAIRGRKAGARRTRMPCQQEYRT